jgi:hypothetical protein
MDNQVDLEQLREAENAGMENLPTATAEKATPAVKAEPASEVSVESEDTGATVVADSQANPSDDAGKPTGTPDLSWLKETPYQSPDELVKGYKNLQAEHTKTSQRYKQYETIVDRLESDFAFQTFLTQAMQGYDNPALLEAYQGDTGKPNPANYDLVDPAQAAKFVQDITSYNERIVDQRLNTRMMDLQRNAKLEADKNAFRAQYPGIDPDEVIKYARSKREWSIADVYKLQNYDNVKSEALAEARKELTKQLEVAQKTKTPQGSATAKTDVRPQDILADISKHGSKYAINKYTEAKVMRALQTTV